MHPLAKAAMTAARKAATNPAAQKQLQKLAVARAGTIASSKLSEAQKQRAQRALAVDMARQIEGGQLSFGTLIDGTPHTVVWAEGTPIQAFPESKGNLEEKLRRHRRDLLVDPPEKRSARSRLPWNRGDQSNAHQETAQILSLGHETASGPPDVDVDDESFPSHRKGSADEQGTN